MRRICGNCKEAVTYPDEYLLAAQLTHEDVAGIEFMRGKGCDNCNGSGYRGRQGLYEVMAMSPTLRRMILQGASTADLQAQAVTEGMLTLRMDGMHKIKKGITTLEEVLKETAA